MVGSMAIRTRARNVLLLGSLLAGCLFSSSAQADAAGAAGLGARGQVPTFHVEAPGAPRGVLGNHGELSLSKLTPGAKAHAQLSGTLHVATEGDYLLVASGDGGLKLTVDGKPVFEAAAPRVYYAAGDTIPVHLAAGAHALRIETTKAATFGLRVLGTDLRPASGVEWSVPDSIPADASDLAVVVHSTFEPGGVRLGLHVTRSRASAAEQAEPLQVEVRGDENVLFAASIGRVPFPAAETSFALPTFAIADASTLVVTVKHGTRTTQTTLHFHVDAQRAVVRARAAARATCAACKLGSQDSVLHLADVLEELERTQDPDLAFATQTVHELDALCTKLEAGTDPYEGRVGPQRRALRSPVDGKLYEFGLYVPAKPQEHPPLIVILHGLHGRPMTMLRYLFGGDDSQKTPVYKDRHWDDSLPALDAVAIAPSGHGDSTYRWLAEDESLRLVEWAKTVLAVDPDRVTMTGASMGGIGAAAIPLHHPGIFAAAAPLCGYHSYFLRSDVGTFSHTSWERFLAEERSNVLWAENGRDLPLFIAHGQQDLPVANSGVLIDRYEQLKYRIVHEHPNVGHNVWQPTYENLKGAHWLLTHTRRHPNAIHFRTVRPRYGRSNWLTVVAQLQSGEWTDVRAKHEAGTFTLTTLNVRELAIDRAEAAAAGAVHVDVDGAPLDFADGEQLVLHQDDKAQWQKGPLAATGSKRGLRTGPFRDLYHEPLAFIFGTRDPAFTAANEEVAHWLSHVKPGVRVDYPVLRDDEASAIPAGTSLVLVGPARSNALRAQLDGKLPSHVTGDTLTFGTQTFRGPGIGASYIYPHPTDPNAYVAIVEGVDPLGVRAALALPELLPDFLVYDQHLEAARGQILLGRGQVKAAGYFDSAWAVPAKTDAKGVTP